MNIGCPQYITVAELAPTVVDVVGKELDIKYIHAPVGVQSRNFSNECTYSIGWRSRFRLRDGISLTYP